MVKSFQPSSEIVPPGLDATKWSELEPLYTELLERELHCKNCLQRLILDRSELDAAVSEAFNTLYIRMTCHTEDATISKAFEDFVEHVEPKLKAMAFKLNRKIVESPASRDLDAARYGVMLRDLKAEVELFREENLPLFTEISKLEQKYAQVCGSMMVKFQGQERTMPQMGAFQEDADREVREAAWRASIARRAQDSKTLDDFFEQLVKLRHRVALNAGFKNFRDYAFKMKRRFDYTPETCHEYARGIEAHVTPLARKATAERARRLGIPSVRPWDALCDVDKQEALKPFGDASELVDKTARIFDRMDPELSAMFRFLCDTPHGAAEEREGVLQHSLDLDSRKGKAPGGYQSNRDRVRKPFIFMNAAGVQRDVETLVHEAGHAFHSLLTRDEPLLHYRSEIPLEFCEVASMSMELLSYPYLDEFYTEDEARRAKRTHLEQMLKLLTGIAVGDQFQHWVYLHPEHTREERHAKWRELVNRYGAGVDWSGLEEELGSVDWQRILHLYQTPFYYIEYAIAQLGALQIWSNSRAEVEKQKRNGGGAEVGRETLGAYKRALSLGGSRPLPELFKAAGAEFDFGPPTIGRLVKVVESQLEAVSA
jgi:oligoendopeptidase F